MTQCFLRLPFNFALTTNFDHFLSLSPLDAQSVTLDYIIFAQASGFDMMHSNQLVCLRACVSNSSFLQNLNDRDLNVERALLLRVL